MIALQFTNRLLLSQPKTVNQLKKLAHNGFDLLSDQKKGWLCFNENGSGKGFGDGGIVAILIGAPELTASNLEFV